MNQTVRAARRKDHSMDHMNSSTLFANSELIIDSSDESLIPGNQSLDLGDDNDYIPDGHDDHKSSSKSLSAQEKSNHRKLFIVLKEITNDFILTFKEIKDHDKLEEILQNFDRVTVKNIIRRERQKQSRMIKQRDVPDHTMINTSLLGKRSSTDAGLTFTSHQQ